MIASRHGESDNNKKLLRAIVSRESALVGPKQARLNARPKPTIKTGLPPGHDWQSER